MVNKTFVRINVHISRIFHENKVLAATEVKIKRAQSEHTSGLCVITGNRRKGWVTGLKVEETGRWEVHTACPWWRAQWQPAPLSLVAGSSQRGSQQSTGLWWHCSGCDVCPSVLPSFQPLFPFTSASSRPEQKNTGFCRRVRLWYLSEVIAVGLLCLAHYYRSITAEIGQAYLEYSAWWRPNTSEPASVPSPLLDKSARSNTSWCQKMMMSHQDVMETQRTPAAGCEQRRNKSSDMTAAFHTTHPLVWSALFRTSWFFYEFCFSHWWKNPPWHCDIAVKVAMVTASEVERVQTLSICHSEYTGSYVNDCLERFKQMFCFHCLMLIS